MPGFVPVAPNPDDPRAAAPAPRPATPSVPSPPAAPTPSLRPNAGTSPASGNAGPPAPQRFGNAGNDWLDLPPEPTALGGQGPNRLPLILTVVLVVLGTAFIGYGAYTYLTADHGKAPSPAPTIAPAPTPTGSTSPSPTGSTSPSPTGSSTLQPIPNVTGLTVDEAKQAIKAAGFIAGNVTERPSPKPAGTVLLQEPVAGAQSEQGTKVNLTVAAAATATTVPDVTGMTRQEAAQALSRAGLKVGSVKTAPARDAAGTVIAQSPAVGENVPEGSAVTLTLAEGQVKIPDVTGMNQKQATRTLGDAGFKVKVIKGNRKSGRPGTVVKQQPGPRATGAPGSTVTITVAPPRR